MIRLKVPIFHVILVCEQGHKVNASVMVPLGIDAETGEYEMLLGDDWTFCDSCEPCENFEACMDGDPCEACLRGWRSEASQEAGRLLTAKELERLVTTLPPAGKWDFPAAQG